MTLSATAECSGSFGELLQGALSGGRKFLINLKIKQRSLVQLSLRNCAYSLESEERFAESYKQYSKSYKVLRNIMSDFGRHEDAFLSVESDIPIGKGLSSSTADMVATVRAAEKALSITLDNDYIGKLLTEIEPNDGLHWPGTSAYFHTVGTRIDGVEWVPPLKILGIDFGGTVDTVAFNRQKIDWKPQQIQSYEALLKRASEALRAEDVRTLCEIASTSTRMWQDVSPKKHLESVLEFQAQTGAWGVVNTHSGPYLGLLYPSSDQEVFTKHLEAARKIFPDFECRVYETISVQT